MKRPLLISATFVLFILGISLGAILGANDHPPFAADQISAGTYHTCVLRSDTTIWCWGANERGELGNNRVSASISTPNLASLPVVNPTTPSSWRHGWPGFAEVSAGRSVTCAVRIDGSAWCWGTDFQGQLGNDSSDRSLTSRSAVPVQVRAVGNLHRPRRYLKKVHHISAGGRHVCATVGAALRVVCWGGGLSGELGSGSVTGESHIPSPVRAVNNTGGYLDGATQISVGSTHTCALLKGGEVACWGNNLKGQLGNDSYSANSPFPVLVHGLGGNGYLEKVAQISAGGNHTCAIVVGAKVVCWGSNSSGELGIGSTNNRRRPVLAHAYVGSVSGPLVQVTAIDAGDHHTCALIDVRWVIKTVCWGSNQNGQVGDGSIGTDRLEPVSVSAWPDHPHDGTQSISAGGAHTCAAVLSDSSVECWGSNHSSQIGTGSNRSPANILIPSPLVYHWLRSD